MKNILFIIIFLSLAAVAVAQPKSQRRIYLWDVTLSMKGYGGTPDIYSDVVKFLEKQIEGITDENTEIVVLPFQERILARWAVRADAAGKEGIIREIKNYQNGNITNTDIVNPVRDVMANIIKPDKNNLLILLTDGEQSEKLGGKAELTRLIEQWGSYAGENFAYCLYVALVPGIVPEDIEKEIEKAECIDVIEPDGVKNFELIDLQPAELVVKVNIKEDKTAKIPLNYNKSVALPENIKIKITAQDSILNIDQTVMVQEGKIAFDMKYKSDYQTLKKQLSENTRLPLQIELINKKEIENATGKIVTLTNNNIELELINRPEKTLKITVRKEEKR